MKTWKAMHDLMEWVVSVIGCWAIPLMLALPLVLVTRWIRRRREAREIKAKVTQAIADITADGKVTPPPGPYVAHHPWGVGTEPKTPHETAPPRPRGHYNIPWPR